MSPLVQNLIALLLVAACVAYVGKQLFRTISFGNGKVGSCCGKGCATVEEQTKAATPAGGVQFISSDSLRRKR